MVTDSLISIIIRFHDETRIPLLDQALFSLATQTYPNVQVILAVQNGTPALTARLAELIRNQPFLSRQTLTDNPSHNPNIRSTAVFNHLILEIPVDQGTDGRSLLINKASLYAQGRYLAFLDYDDVMYHHAYALLIGRLRESGAAIAVGGCRRAHQQVIDHDHFFIKRKEHYLCSERNKYHLIGDNFIPIHSYVLDRNIIDAKDIQFNTELTCLEDYVFLLGLVAKYQFDFSLVLIPMAEYRWRLDGSNTVDLHNDAHDLNEHWKKSREYVARLKESLLLQVTAADIAMITNETTRFRDKNYELAVELAHYVKEFHFYKNERDFYKNEWEHIHAIKNTLAFKAARNIHQFLQHHRLIKQVIRWCMYPVIAFRNIIASK